MKTKIIPIKGTVQYKNNRFYSEGVSFHFLDGYFVSEEANIPEGYFSLLSPDKTILLIVSVNATESKNAEDAIKTYFKQGVSAEDISIIQPVSPFSSNDMSGYNVSYRWGDCFHRQVAC